MTGTITASGGAGLGTNQSGGNAGAVNLTATTILSAAAITASTGAATGTGAGGAAGSITLTGGTVTAVALTTTGGSNGNAGNITATATGGLLNLTGNLAASGGTAIAGANGANGVQVQLAGSGGVTALSLTAAGSAGNGADRNGGSGGAVSVMSSGAAITAGAISVSGGNSGAGNANGGNAGAVVLNAGGPTPTITMNNVTANGGNRAGSGMAGNGGNIIVQDAALLSANTTISALGGSAGTGAGGAVTFAGTIDSSGATRSLTINTNGATTLSGAIGDTQVLNSLTLDAGGSTSLGGNVTTTSNQSYNDALTLTANVVLTGATPTLGSTINGGGFDLTLDFGNTTTLNGANVSNIRNLLTRGGGTTQLTGALTTTGSQTYNDAVTLTGDTTLSATGDVSFIGAVNGARMLAVNTSGVTTFGAAVGNSTPLTGLTTDAVGSTRLADNVTTTNGPVSFGDAVLLTGDSIISTGSGAVTFSGTVNGARALTVNSTGLTTLSGAVGVVTPLSSLTTNAGGTTVIDGGAVTTTGSQTYNNAVSVSGAATLSAGGSISAADAVTATGGLLTLNAGTGITLTNAGNDFTTVLASVTAGDLALTDTNNLILNGVTANGSVRVVAGADLTLNGAVTTTATATESIVMSAGGNFINNAGAAALATGAGGSWLVYSSSPLLDSSGSLVPDFKHYNQPYTGAPYGGPGTGNGFLYSLAPVITSTLIGAVAKGYDGTTAAGLVAGNYSTGGVVAGDTVTLNNPATGSYADRNAGTGKNVSVTGISIVGAVDANAVPVFGYQLASTSANANIGEITAAPLTVTAQADSRVYDGTTGSAVAPVLSGTLYDAVGTAATQSYDNRNAGAGKTLSANGLSVADGNGGNNYAVTYVANNTGVITAAPLTVTAQVDNRVYDGTTGSAATPVLTGTLYDAVGTAATQSYDNRNAGTGKTLSASGLIVADGNGGNNYAINYVTNTTGVITAAPLTVTAQADNRVYDGTTASVVAPVVGGTLYDAVGTAATQSYDNRNAGTGKTLTASGLIVADGNGGNNYAISYVANTTGVITAASLTVTANDAARVVGAPNPMFSASYAGLLGGDTPASLSGILLFTTPADTTSAAGIYAINVTGQMSTNYALTYIPGLLTVFATPPTPLMSPMPSMPTMQMLPDFIGLRNVLDPLFSIRIFSARGNDDPTLPCGVSAPIATLGCIGGGGE